MWHETMLAGCKLVWDCSYSSVTLKAQTSGSLVLNYCFKPKLKLKRVLAEPGAVQAVRSYSEWRNDDLGQRNQQGDVLLGRESHSKRNLYIWQSVSVTMPAQDSRPVFSVTGNASSNLAMSRSAIGTTDVEISSLLESEPRMPVYSGREREGNVADSEKLRRHRISIANKGKVPWNKGCKHSAETIKRIKEKTTQAMQSPTVMAKLRLNARHSQTNETKVKIRDKLRHRWDNKKRIRGYQEIMLKEWKHYVAEAARMGGVGEEEMQWNSYGVIKSKLRLDAAALRLSEKKLNKFKKKAERPRKSEEHRLKISAAIKAKWEDPEYKLKVREGMVKNNDAIKAQKRAHRRKPSGDGVTSEAGCIRGPLDHGFVTAVMLGEKKRQQKEVAVKEQKEDCPATAKTKLRARDRKVNLLKRCTEPSQVEEVQFSEDYVTDELSVSAEHSFVDPLAGEKLFRLKLLQASRSMINQRRIEATQHAKVLMAEAEQAAKKLEVAAGNNESAQARLVEIYRLVAEAKQFLDAADLLNRDFYGQKSHDQAFWRSTIASHQSTKNLQQMTPGEIDGHHLSQQSGQDIAMGARTASPTLESIKVLGNETRIQLQGL